jgi:hypothetical protein
MLNRTPTEPTTAHLAGAQLTKAKLPRLLLGVAVIWALFAIQLCRAEGRGIARQIEAERAPKKSCATAVAVNAGAVK